MTPLTYLVNFEYVGRPPGIAADFGPDYFVDFVDDALVAHSK
jgi:hypothetical protein